MVFSSILFLFRFMPIAFLLYYITPQKLKNLVILLLSLAFYSWGEPKYFPIMIASILCDYFASKGIEHNRDKKWVCKLFLMFSIVFNIGMLMFFKYTNFFIENFNAATGLSIQLLKLTLPLGISFYTFQTLSYTIDVYRGDVKAENNIIDFGAFVCLFPQLIAGPIVKYTDINRELKTRKVNLDQIQEGIKWFIFGLGKKVLIANNIGSLWDEVQRLGFANISTPLAWLGILAFSLQIYFDFSGYSLMAIGLGKMLGFDFPQNFNFPYISRSMTEFWRRWHMTLGSWFREYLYIPLGGNRKGKIRMYLNLFIVWAATGFWHGANWNFLLWGILFAVLLILEKAWLLKYLERGKVWPHIYVIFLLLLSWALFAITDLSQLSIFLQKLFSFDGGIDWIYYLRSYFVTIFAAILLSMPLVEKFYNKVEELEWANIALLALILITSVAYLVDATYNPFLYFRF
ncbi:alginate O-acetyltransferase complex protein AlgI [Hydrogenoanaerobacterium saccharovorans]|uniref:Alginate O-acetyltransferase complex protein AlgI n=1 Tax=Hydrogenoanaerobacterium saccharovorans TaxID=474960 RepID=A0A1H7ZFJ6_9FIRM|nr:MBOAT family O-acyltransferase [Hydrogenoanaerobacterium saccharovorans]RPF48675.1 alginate O-acetyltransferase complex protein AlgI [Hydrogenoanaerobacterium saccharovorans]SEM56289.1 alginate O-acetyltransferase complex protein AlgI [Hydrogenoanaerobacterium saccharovorans]